KHSSSDSLQLNLEYTRSWFQNPNSFDAQNATAWFGFTEGNVLLPVNDNEIGPNVLPVQPADQRSQIQTFNISPTWTRFISSIPVRIVGAVVRRDAYNYYPSGNPFADLGASSTQREPAGQYPTLLNAGGRASNTYVKGIHNIKPGIPYKQTSLSASESF